MQHSRNIESLVGVGAAAAKLITMMQLRRPTIRDLWGESVPFPVACSSIQQFRAGERLTGFTRHSMTHTHKLFHGFHPSARTSLCTPQGKRRERFLLAQLPAKTSLEDV